MSYSFSVKAASKDEAVAAVSAKFDEIVANEPLHDNDRAVAQSAAEACIGLVHINDSQDILVSVHGSVAWQGDGLISASFGVNASRARRETTTG